PRTEPGSSLSAKETMRLSRAHATRAQGHLVTLGCRSCCIAEFFRLGLMHCQLQLHDDLIDVRQQRDNDTERSSQMVARQSQVRGIAYSGDPSPSSQQTAGIAS